MNDFDKLISQLKIENTSLAIKKDYVTFNEKSDNFFNMIWELDDQIELNLMMIKRIEQFVASEMATEEQVQDYITNY